MGNEKIKKGIEEIQDIQMTYREREIMLNNIMNSSKKEKPIRSPYFFASMFQKKYLIYYGMVFCLIIILSSNKGTVLNNTNTQNTDYLEPKISQNNQETTNLFPKKTSTPKEKIIGYVQEKNVSVAPTSLNTKSGIAGQFNSITSSSSSQSISDSQRYNQIASDAFKIWLEKLIAEKGGVTEYKIEQINFVATKNTTSEPERFWFSANTSNEAFIVTVNYSVKTIPGNDNFWMAGNGRIGGDGWIFNKSLFVTIDKQNNEYIVKSAGTGP